MQGARAGVVLEDGGFVQGEHLAEFAEGLEVFLGSRGGGLVAVSVAVRAGLGEVVGERVEAAAVFDQSGDVDLSADEVADGAPVVVEGRCEEEVHEWGSIAPVVEDRLARLLSGFDCCADPGDGCSVGLWALQETAVPSQDIVSRVS